LFFTIFVVTITAAAAAAATIIVVYIATTDIFSIVIFNCAENSNPTSIHHSHSTNASVASWIEPSHSATGHTKWWCKCRHKYIETKHGNSSNGGGCIFITFPPFYLSCW
jgi:hypothetical protein